MGWSEYRAKWMVEAPSPWGGGGVVHVPRELTPEEAEVQGKLWAVAEQRYQALIDALGLDPSGWYDDAGGGWSWFYRQIEEAVDHVVKERDMALGRWPIDRAAWGPATSSVCDEGSD